MGARQKRKRIKSDEVTLEMTPMIDVVFQLLIYFVVTITPVDVAAHLDVFRPAAGAPPPNQTEPPKMIQIEIYSGALLMNGRSVDMDGLVSIIAKLSALSKTQTVMIKCARDSEHEKLIEVLDACSEYGMKNLSVASMN